MKTKLTAKEIDQSYLEIKEKSQFDLDFLVLTICATVICALGIYMNNLAVVIGSMIISPLLYPIINLATSIIKFDLRISLKQLFFQLVSFFLVIFIAFLISKIFPINQQTVRENYLNNQQLIYSAYFLIALFSGIAACFCFFWPGILDALAGIAISIALLPPLTVLGFTFSLTNDQYLPIAYIVILNYLGIFLGSLIMVFILNITSEEKS
ncbi:MAG: TIGR00341 family protein [Candidatus Moranbacteria bacterium]|nr:TIGR00341 family protein [Candidatus Moranbacteria bacterium]